MTDHAARWEERYRRPGPMFGAAPNAFLRAQAGRIPGGGRVLVPGDGDGRNGVWLATRGFDVTTVEWAGSGVAKARALADAHGVGIDAMQADLTAWDWPARAFDAVALVFVHLPPADRLVVHAGIARALRPGGLLVVESFRPGQVELQRASPDGRGSGGPGDPALLLAAADLRADFPGADWLVLAETDTVLDEGTHHRGPARVTRAVGRLP